MRVGLEFPLNRATIDAVQPTSRYSNTAHIPPLPVEHILNAGLTFVLLSIVALVWVLNDNYECDKATFLVI